MEDEPSCYLCPEPSEFGGHWVKNSEVQSRHVCALHREFLSPDKTPARPIKKREEIPAEP